MANKEPTKGQQQTTYNPRKQYNRSIGYTLICIKLTLPTPVGSSKIIH